MSRFAHTFAYIDSLPEGLESHPDCHTKAAIYRSYLERSPIDAELLGELPEPLADLLVHPRVVSTWLPAVHSLALTMVFRDLFAPEHDSFAEFVRTSTAEMYSTPMYRVLMVAMNPQRLLKAASLRWTQFNRGSKMTVLPTGETSARVEFDFPSHLYSRSHHAGLQGAYEAALAVAGAKAIETAIDRFGEERLVFDFRWRN